MIIATQCLVCHEEAGAQVENEPYFVVQVGDSNMVPARCPQGHDFVIALQAYKYQILFEYAVLAYADSYYREAVSSAATALERAYEHYVKTVVALQRDMEQALEMWRSIGNASERQLGAFIALYTTREGAPPPRIEKAAKIGGRTPVEFRNDAVHKGYIPTAEEAKSYLAFVLEHIRLINDRLEAGDVDRLREHDMRYRYSAADIEKYKGQFKLFLGMPMAADFERHRPGGRRDINGTIETALAMQAGMRSYVANSSVLVEGDSLTPDSTP